MSAAPQASEEDLARANVYGLLARLFYRAPDSQLLGELLNSSAFREGDTELTRAWAAMLAAGREAFPVQLENEHTELFVGTGKAEVTPYLSHYMDKRLTDHPLVELRGQLAQWGIAKRADAAEPEDHISGICEAMRFAIAVQQRSLAEQRDFFERYLFASGLAFCDAVSGSAKAGFYRSVAQFARAFFQLERDAFELE